MSILGALGLVAWLLGALAPKRRRRYRRGEIPVTTTGQRRAPDHSAPGPPGRCFTVLENGGASNVDLSSHGLGKLVVERSCSIKGTGSIGIAPIPQIHCSSAGTGGDKNTIHEQRVRIFDPVVEMLGNIAYPAERPRMRRMGKCRRSGRAAEPLRRRVALRPRRSRHADEGRNDARLGANARFGV